MSEDYLNNLDKLTKSFAKIDTLTELARPLNSLNFKTISDASSVLNNMEFYSNKVLQSQGIRTGYIMPKAYLEPQKINSLFNSLYSIQNMMNSGFDDKFVSTSKLFLDLQNKARIANPVLEFSKIATYNWRENFPHLFVNRTENFSSPNKVKDLGESLSKLYGLVNVEDEDITISDGLKVSLTINPQSENDEFKKIYELTADTIDNIDEINDNTINFIYDLFQKWIRFTKKYPLAVSSTAGFLTGLLFHILASTSNKPAIINNIIQHNYTINQNQEETIISNNDIWIKEKRIKNLKDFAKIPAGSEVKIIEKHKVWALVLFINSDGVPQSGYCRIEDLE